jgi:hypothetical protein
MVNRGMVGMYLADRKARQQQEVWIVAKEILPYGGTLSRIAFIYYRVHAIAQRKRWLTK